MAFQWGRRQVSSFPAARARIWEHFPSHFSQSQCSNVKIHIGWEKSRVCHFDDTQHMELKTINYLLFSIITFQSTNEQRCCCCCRCFTRVFHMFASILRARSDESWNRKKNRKLKLGEESEDEKTAKTSQQQQAPHAQLLMYEMENRC